MNLVLRGDASAALGLGHLARLCAIGDAVHDAGGASELVVGGDIAAAIGFAAGFGHAAVAAASTDADRESADLLARAGRLDATIVLDGVGVAERLAPRLAGRGRWIAIVDDLGLARGPADVVINHNHGADVLAPGYRSTGASRLLLGRDYLLLRRSVRAQPRGACVPRRARPRVVVSFGGSDPVGATARVVAAMPALATGLELVVVTGPGFTAAAGLGEAIVAAVARGHHVQRVHAPPDLAGLFVDADAAITAAGGTVGELAYLGCPTCAYAIVDDQRAGAARLAVAGLIHGGDWLAELSDAALCTSLDRFLSDPPLRLGLRAAALATADGRGAARVAAAL